MHHLAPSLQAELVGRLALAVLLGSVLGWERQMGRHPAGLRTHMLVALGSAAYTIAGTYGVAGFGTVQDAGRIAAQVVTGIGFIGAGTIWRSSGEEGAIRGLTTAASIWVAASIGMLAAYGLYVLAIGTALISLFVLRMMRRVEPAPRVLGTAVARRFRRTPPASFPASHGAAPAPEEPVLNGQTGNGETVMAESDTTPDTVSEARRAKRERMHKKLRKGKKEQKRKRGDASDNDDDTISDAPAESGGGG